MKGRCLTLAMSIMALMSLLHSIRVSRRFLPDTTVTGPWKFKEEDITITFKYDINEKKHEARQRSTTNQKRDLSEYRHAIFT